MRDLNGVSVVITGEIPGHSRQTASAALRDAGAVVQSSVGRSTQLLVTGGKVGRVKIEAAERNGVEVVPWDELWRDDAAARVDVVVIDSDGVREGTLTSDAHGDVIVPRRQIGPMLAQAGELPSGPGWQFEVKWDGNRCVATVHDGSVTMMSRSGVSNYVDAYPAIAKLLGSWPNVVLDGELVVLTEQGHAAIGRTENKPLASYVVFDVMELLGEDLRRMPLSDRRRVLEEDLMHLFGGHAFSGGGKIVVSPTFPDGEVLLAEMSRRGLEGVVAKRLTSRYLEGSRGGDWIKVKIRHEQEFVVVGWTPGKNGRRGQVGGLLLAVREHDRWVYVGKVGAGPDDLSRDVIKRRLEEAAYPANRPVLGLDTGKATRALLRTVTWVRPELVVQVAFQRWSEDGVLVIPSCKRIRDDKDPLQVGRQP